MDKSPEATRILIVDDDPSNVELVAEILATAGYRTVTAGSGPEALRRARPEPPDLIVLDLRMPDMDGFEVCRHLKADARTAAVPILLVTGRAEPEDKERGVAAGGDDYVTKPLDARDFLARVRSLLRVCHLSQELDRTLAYLQELEAARRVEVPVAGVRGAGAGQAAAPGRGGRAAKDAMAPGTGVAAAAGGPAHVLIVDDDRFIRQLFGNLLKAAGYRVTEAADAAEAYEAAGRGVDVILLDVMMPNVSGLEALERLRQIAPDVPILIVTAYQSAPNAIAALRGGAFDFIVKGMKAEILLNGVARAVERRHLMVENRHLMEQLRARLDAALASPVAPAR
jgi:CheY-like chemotaxis protein